MEDEVIDITEVCQEYGYDCVAAERLGNEVIILYKLDNPIKNLDGDMCIWEVESRTIRLTGSEDDFANVMSNDFSYFKEDEINPDKPLIREQLNLF